MVQQTALGFRMKAQSMAEALMLVGSQRAVLQPLVDLALRRLFAMRVATVADDVVAAVVLKEPFVAAYVPMLELSAWTLASSRLAREQQSHQQGLLHAPQVNAEVAFRLWLLPSVRTLLGEVTSHVPSVLDTVLAQPGVVNCGYTGGAAPAGVSAGEWAERAKLWSLTERPGASCLFHMRCEAAWPSFDDVVAHLEAPSIRAVRIARQRAVRLFVAKARAAGLPEAGLPAKALAVLNNKESSLYRNSVAETAKLTPALLSPYSLATKLNSPLNELTTKAAAYA